MAYKCRMCGVFDVDEPGGVCQLCAVGQDPYAGQGQESRNVDYGDTYGGQKAGYAHSSSKRKILVGGAAGNNLPGTYQKNSPVAREDTEVARDSGSVPVYRPGQVNLNQYSGAPSGTVSGAAQSGQGAQGASKGGAYETKGIIKNVTTDVEKYPFFIRFLRAIFFGIPISFYNDLTMFQVFPDYTGQSLNAQGYACDQVVVYGTVKAGVVSENNDVEVYGRRDRNNNIIATKIKNTASGATVVPGGTISPTIIRVIFILVLLIIFGIISAIGGAVGALI